MTSFFEAVDLPVAPCINISVGTWSAPQPEEVWSAQSIGLQRDSIAFKSQHFCLFSWIWITLMVLHRGWASANENNNSLLRWYQVSDTSLWCQVTWHKACSLLCPEGVAAVGQQKSPASLSHSTEWLYLGSNCISAPCFGSWDVPLTCKHLTQIT